ncbi:MAG: DUF86 domain-containing protein [Phycisphaerales bacterium]
MPRDDAARVRDIVDACGRIERATRGMDAAGFAANDLVIRAVPYDFAVIGEAAKGVSAAMRSRHPDVPWADMAGMRDVVIHQYFGVDAALVWRAATVHVPVVRTLLDSLGR